MDSLAEGTFYLLDGNYAIITAGTTTQKESLSGFTSSQKDREDFQKAWDAIDHEENPQGKCVTIIRECPILHTIQMWNARTGVCVSQRISALRKECE